MFYIFFYILNTEHVKKKYKKRKGKLNIIHRRLTHNYILNTKKKTNETKTQYLLFYLHEKKKVKKSKKNK